MPRPGITRDQVFDAANALAQAGTQPTVKLIREQTGGSYSTITPHLADWKEERAGTTVANIPDMPESVTTASKAMWAAAWRAAQDLIQTERDGLTAARREMEKERADMANEITELETELERALKERDSLTTTLEKERKGHQQAQKDLSKLEIENARLEERVENTTERADELRDQVKRLEGELARLAQEKSTEKTVKTKRAAPKKKTQ